MDMNLVPRFRYVPRDDGNGFQIEQRMDVKDNGVWLDYFWQDTGDSCDTLAEATQMVANAITDVAAPAPPICDCCGGGPMLDRGGFYDCFCCGHNREKGEAR